MAETHVLSALVAKHSRLSGKLAACEEEAQKLRTALSHIEASIRLFKDDYDIRGIRIRRTHKRSTLFRKGEMLRTALDILRTSNEPLSSRELAVRTFQRMGIPKPEEKAVQVLRNTLNASLLRRLRKGSVANDGRYPKRWSIILS